MAKSFESRNKDLSTRLQKARKFWVSHKRCMVFGYKNVHGSPIRSWLPKSRTWGVQCHSNQESRACMSLIKTPMYRFYFAKSSNIFTNLIASTYIFIRTQRVQKQIQKLYITCVQIFGNVKIWPYYFL